ncbi:hypothetical protein HZS_2984, partial [Henneguya salminicola]
YLNPYSFQNSEKSRTAIPGLSNFSERCLIKYQNKKIIHIINSNQYNLSRFFMGILLIDLTISSFGPRI